MIKLWRKRLYKFRYILIILSAILWLLGLSSSFWAYWSDGPYIRQIWVYGYNPYQQAFDMSVLNSWLPLTQTLWITKNMFYFENKYYWWRDSEGLPYVYIANDDNSPWCQGYITNYYTCSSIGGSWSIAVSNCSSLSVSSGTPEVFRAFFSNVSNSDYYQFNKWGADFWTTWEFYISSDSLWQSIWRRWIQWVWGCGSAGLTWSKNYTWISFDSFVNSMWNNSAWGVPSGWGGWNVVNVWEDITNWQVSDALNSYWFSKNICYGGVSASADYSSSIPWTWKTMFQLYQEFNPTWISNIVDWYAYYKEGYIDYPYFQYSWGAYITDSHSPFLVNWNFMLSLYRLFQYWDRFGVSFYPASDIVEYCDLLLNKDPDSLYTWEDWKSIVDNSNIIDYWSAVYRALSWDTQQLYSWSISNLSWENLSFTSDTFFSRLTDKFSRFMDFDESGFVAVGVIPSYVLYFLFALILIRMISK